MMYFLFQLKKSVLYAKVLLLHARVNNKKHSVSKFNFNKKIILHLFENIYFFSVSVVKITETFFWNTISIHSRR